MNLHLLSEKYNTKEKCILHLEEVRWGDEVICPHCGSNRITPRKKRKYFYHCNYCNKDFTVLVGTIFEGSKMPLPKWFLLIALMLNAKKGISSKQLSRDLGVTYKTAWYSAMRVRCAMVDEGALLEGVIEMDEAYIGGKPRHRNTATSSATLSKLMTKRGKGTKQTPIVGIVERKGKKQLRIQIEDKLTTKNLLALLKKYVAIDKATLMTDELPAYKAFDKYIEHYVIKHKEKKYVDGNIHTNTIEGVWRGIKASLKGQYHVLSRKYLPFYLAEFVYKYNRKHESGKETVFDETVDTAVSDDKCLVNYKPKESPDKIVYGATPRPKMADKKPTIKAAVKKRNLRKYGKRKRGRPKGSKDITPRKPRGKAKTKTKYTSRRKKAFPKTVIEPTIELSAKHKRLHKKGLLTQKKMEDLHTYKRKKQPLKGTDETKKIKKPRKKYTRRMKE